MKTKYDLLILGATALGIAAAQAHKDLAVAVIEAGCTCAPEFSAALHGAAVSSPVENRLSDALIRREAMENDTVWLPAAAPVLTDLLKASGADCYFFSAVADIRSTENGYDVDFVCYGVRYTVHADALLDTTTDFVSHAWFGQPAPALREGTLHYLTADKQLHGFSDEHTAIGDIAGARRALPAFHSAIPDAAPITLIASQLAKVPAESGWSSIWMPSAASSDVIAAYERGRLAPIPAAVPTTVPTAVMDGSFDVIVVGFGTAGTSAALTAAGEGLSVLALESLAMPGGSATAGGIFSYYYGFKGGYYRSVDKEASVLPGFAPRSGSGIAKTVIYDMRAKTLSLDVRYESTFTQALTDGNRVVGVRWVQNGVPHEAYAKTVIDCTAEASVCVNAGCAMHGGRLTDGVFQPFSSVYYYIGQDGGLGYTYCDNGVVNPYDADDFGRKIRDAQSSYIHLRASYADHSYFGTAPLIGLREGRKIVGEETVSFEAIMRGNYSRKPLYFGRSNLDNHGKDSALEDPIYRDWITIAGMWGWSVSIPVPKGALIPMGWDGLLAAGRNVSVEHNLAMGLRMKDDAYKSGESAAVLAACSIRQNCSAKDVDDDLLRQKLTERGCLGGEGMLLEQQERDRRIGEPWWCDDDVQLAEELAGDAPGYAIWSAVQLQKTALLHERLHAEDDNSRYHAALALALLDDASAVETLMEAACTKDGVMSKSSRRFGTLRSVAAIAALERLADERAADLLLSMLADRTCTAEIAPQYHDLMIDDEDVRFQYDTHLIRALCAIAKAHPGRRDDIRNALKTAVTGQTFRTSMMGTDLSLKQDCTETIRAMVNELFSID